MLTDSYGLALSTTSAAARDAYVEASGLALTFYPGAAEAYDRAIAADPGFALAHAGKAQVLMRQGDVTAAREALGAAKDAATGLSEREASHIGFFGRLCHGNDKRRTESEKLVGRHAAATALCQRAVASARNIRSVDRETRWREG